MKPYAPLTNIGRIRSIDDIHHKTADQSRKAAKLTAKAVRKAARQEGTKQSLQVQQEGK